MRLQQDATEEPSVFQFHGRIGGLRAARLNVTSGDHSLRVPPLSPAPSSFMSALLLRDKPEEFGFLTATNRKINV